MTEAPKWIMEKYIQNLHLEELEGSPAYFQKLQIDDLWWDMGGAVIRSLRFALLKHDFVLRRQGYTITVVTLASSDEIPIGLIYWAEHGEVPEYVCMYPPYESSDGEYRPHFIWHDAMLKAQELAEPLIEELEAILLRAIAEGQFSLHTYGHTKDYIEDSRLPLWSLIFLILGVATMWANNYMAPHISERFTTVFSELWPLIDKAVKKIMGLPVFPLLRLILVAGSDNQLHGGGGQKLVPLLAHALMHPQNLDFTVWREIFLLELCSDLVINGITPSLAMFNNWTYVYEGPDIMYSTPNILAKYNRSKCAQNTIQQHPLKTIQLIESMAILSETSVLVTQEHVGVTLEAFPKLIRNSPIVTPVLNDLFSNINIFQHMLFQLCYACYSVHKHLTLIHGDIHLQNITFHSCLTLWQPLPTTPVVFEVIGAQKPHVAYILDQQGEASTYLFPSLGGYFCLVDFGRAIFGHSRQVRERIGDLHRLFSDQVQRATTLIHSIFPKTEYAELCKAPHEYFGALTALDYIQLGRSMGDFLELHQGDLPGRFRSLNINPEIIELCRRLEKLATEQFLQASLHKDAEPVGKAIFEELFTSAQFLQIPRKDLHQLTIIDIYNAATRVTYSSTRPAHFPPWTDFDNMSELLNESVDDLVARRRDRRFTLENSGE